MALITAAQFREHFPALTGTAEDTLLDTLIGRADDLMAAWCGYPPYDSGGGLHSLEDQTYTFYPSGPAWDEPRKMILPIKPIQSITSAYVDENEDYGSSTQVASGDMVLDGFRGEIWLTPDASSSWATGGRANKITVVAGFASIPAGLVAIAAAEVRHLLDLRRVQGQGQVTQGGQSTTRNDLDALVPQLVRDGLAPYVIWSSRAG
jgi:hypothetical protein